MSDTMLHGVLRMPPELWGDGEIDQRQRYSRYLEASRRIEDAEREIERLQRELGECTAGWETGKRALAENAVLREESKAERERCAAIARKWGEGHEFYQMVNAQRAANEIADAIEALTDEVTTRPPCNISCRTEDELRVLVELLCHSKGAPGFDKRITRLREEALSKWHKRGAIEALTDEVPK